MHSIKRSNGAPRRRRIARWAPLLALVLGLAGCEGLLEVDNPNNVLQEDLEKPRSASAIVNGAHSATARALSNVLRGHANITDEGDWIGSYNAAEELEHGLLSNDMNEFLYEGFNDLAVSRWTSDEAIRLLEGFEAEGTLPDLNDLGRAYLYAGISYATIADMYEDFAFSDRQEAAPPVGPENMVQVYDTAIARLTRALEIAQQTENEELEIAALAMRARAHWAKALWPKFNPAGQTPAEPLVNSADANADAAAVLALVAGTDWAYRFSFSPQTIDNTAAFWFNSRQELAIGSVYAKRADDGKRICWPGNKDCPEEGIVLNDPIDDIADPALRDIVYEFVEGGIYSPLTVVSEREMHLILAEAALADGDDAGFTTHINHVRQMDGLTPYSGQIPALEMLRHARRVNLYMQVQRRLADLYRFGIVLDEWTEASDARVTPGTFFPISFQERISNCHIMGTC